MVLKRTCLYILLSTVFFIPYWHLQKRATKLPFTGDEPTYIFVANSFFRDGDIDIRNNFEENQAALLELPERLDAYHGFWRYTPVFLLI